VDPERQGQAAGKKPRSHSLPLRSQSRHKKIPGWEIPRDCTRLLHPRPGAVPPGPPPGTTPGGQPRYQAGLLTPGSSYPLRLPPTTPAGVASCRVRPRLQRRVRTGFAPVSLLCPKAPVPDSIVGIRAGLSRGKQGEKLEKTGGRGRARPNRTLMSRKKTIFPSFLN
jgi:hypothetical protein